MEIKKIYWNEIRKVVKNIDNKFYQLVDQLAPGNLYPLYLVSYNYGETIGDSKGTILKNESGEFYHLGDSNTPKDIFENLGYGIKNSPLMMILDKKFEWFISDFQENTSFPIYIEGPGFFIGTRQLLAEKAARTYISSSIMSCTAGTRSAFMLPNIGNQKKHMHLQRQLGITCSTPKDIQNHWEVFKEISLLSGSPWRAKVLIFSSKWIDSLKNDSKWIPVQKYLIEKMIKSWEHDKNYFFYNFAFSKAQDTYNILSNPYLNETTKHILGILLGANLGYRPSTDDFFIPLNEIQLAYQEIYRIEQTPILLEPDKFDIYNEFQLPVYYSLQKPFVCLEKQTKTETRALVNLHSLIRILNKLYAFLEAQKNGDYKGTLLQEIAGKVKFSYFHHSPKQDSKYENNTIINISSDIAKEDARFHLGTNNLKKYFFPSDAKFFRGCIKISKN
ncbi:Uncharacterised protein [Legionella beliardensis]|uniref:Uncharacterized protein n=1 Tax=Legionella beliardensis TaxID=91822 RepID=A0A378HYG2_9GAMM|nr:hypothetical protein [Legionella beliardensis]STX27939.1 Uncharacterised protein [Legionella beliardensis]